MFFIYSRAFGFWLDMICVCYSSVAVASMVVRGAKHEFFKSTHVDVRLQKFNNLVDLILAAKSKL